MSNASNIQIAISEAVARLSAYQQQLLLLFIESMQPKESGQGLHLLGFAGSISTADLHIMEASIQTGCENIDEDGW